jgi:hypothetical protein
MFGQLEEVAVPLFSYMRTTDHFLDFVEHLGISFLRFQKPKRDQAKKG